MEGNRCLFGTFLRALEVPFTHDYSARRFDTMTFQSLFGLSKLLEEYGVPNEALELPDKEGDLDKLTPPYLARVGSTFAVVTDAGDTVELNYGDGTGPKRIPREEFMKIWSGVVLLAYPAEKSAEPDYGMHKFVEIGNKAKRWVLSATCLFIFAYLFISNGLYRHVSTVLLTTVDLAGLYVTYHLVLKSLNIHSERGDDICSLLDRTGCHTVLSTSASKFFGLFGWSEVGLSFFSVSLGCLLVFPEYIGYLALVNACACPFSFWSVWYQKYRAKAWCTLCLITQGCLWLSLACYAFGGWFRGAFPLSLQFFVLCATYVAALLGLNAIMPAMDKSEQ